VIGEEGNVHHKSAYENSNPFHLNTGNDNIGNAWSQRERVRRRRVVSGCTRTTDKTDDVGNRSNRNHHAEPTGGIEPIGQGRRQQPYSDGRGFRHQPTQQ
jgi:hypothetical protein